MTFNERLTALGAKVINHNGCMADMAVFMRTVEVYEGRRWNSGAIKSIGNKNGILTHFTSLVIKNQLYVFGNI